ncbi:MAG TPA: galactose-1-phosphate uridylyltransferase [Syntrophorhabdaceae bacterium]|nr:galactose-1-phosphate uridylyltransferase [Syntrophorhabdaceae bacterium]
MSEVRLNHITGDWVIVSAERAKRPEDFAQKRQSKELPAYVASCPFCPGNETDTPTETFRLTSPDGAWSVRSVLNKFSALSPEGDVRKEKVDFKQVISGVGRHEVIIETPEHNKTTALLSVHQMERVLAGYRDRLIAFYEDPRVEHVIIFKNHGIGAGTSLEHPHSQIVGTPVFPGQVMTRLEEARRNYYYVNFGECLYCTYMYGEMNEKVRIVSENASFVAFIPYAAHSPFHTWIFPKRHCACYGCISEDEIKGLAGILRDVLRRMYVGLDNPDFNYVIRSLSTRESDSKYFHWYISVIPRITQTAGFELGTGMYINTALPEESARFLRDVGYEFPGD